MTVICFFTVPSYAADVGSPPQVNSVERRVMAFYYPWYGTAEGPGGAGKTVHWGRIDADNKRVGMLLPSVAGANLAVVEFSTKPLVNLVWIGALLTVLGAILAGIRRAIEVAPRRRAGRAPLSPAGSGAEGAAS